MSSALAATPGSTVSEKAQSRAALIARPDVYADAIVYPADQPLRGQVLAQPSKNYTSRYLLAAALAEGESLVRNCATSDDARAMQRGLRAMGAEIEILGSSNGVGEDVRVVGFGGKPRLRNPGEPINVGNAGAVLRLLLGVGALLPEVTFVTSHPESLGKRPNADLLRALEQLGCEAAPAEGFLPITLRGRNLRGGIVQVSGAKSSQFLSSLLFLAPLVGQPLQIEVTGGLVSKAPVRQTVEVLRNFGVEIAHTDDLLSFQVNPQSYQSGEHGVNGDWPGSAALLSAAVVTNGEVHVQGLYNDQQGERESERVLGSFGGNLQLLPNGEGVKTNSATGDLHAVNFDGDLATDAVLALLAPACFAHGRSRFYNVANLRIKECDRITEPLRELRKLGVKCCEGHEVADTDPDAILIEGNPRGYDGGVTVDGRGDHRVIMLLSIVALRCRKPVTITGAHHVAKSYPAFFQHLASLGAKLELRQGSGH